MNSLVSTQWLAENLGDPNCAILDASLHLPTAERDAKAEYEAAHIPGARYLDLRSLTNTASSVPAALPNAAILSRRLAELGVTPSTRIILYDESALKTSARAWFALNAHGIEQVAILDGGLGKWRDEGRPMEAGAAQVDPVEPADLPDAQRVATKDEMLANCISHTEQVLDARGADRVFGAGTDPVHGGQNGRIPGALNLPFGKVFRNDGTYQSPTELRALFESAGVDLDRPLVTTCGSGVTASVLLFAAHLAGKEDVRLYDGSWMEWEADPETPKEQGPA